MNAEPDNIANLAIQKFTAGKEHTNETLLKDIHFDLDFIKNCYLEVMSLNNPDSIDRIQVGPESTVGQLWQQYFNLRERDQVDWS